MKKIALYLTLILVILIWGCTTDSVPTEAVQSDEQLIQKAIVEIEEAETEDYFYGDIDEESDENFLKPVDSFLEKPVVPFRFGRIRLQPLVKDVHIVFSSDSTAEASYRLLIRGNFVALVGSLSTIDTMQVYRTNRPMIHQIERLVNFVKINGKWRMKEFSMALGHSLSVVNTEAEMANSTLQIVKMILTSGDRTIEVKDPLDFFQTRASVFTFSNGTTVRIKIWVSNTTESPVYYPDGTDQTELVRLHHARHRLHRYHGVKYFSYLGQEDGLNVYEGSWVIGQWPGVHHAVIDVIDNGTIFDDDINKYPYNSTTWSTPYRITIN